MLLAALLRSTRCSASMRRACPSEPTLLRQRPVPYVAPLNAPHGRSNAPPVLYYPCAAPFRRTSALAALRRRRWRSAVRAPGDAGALSASVEPM